MVRPLPIVASALGSKVVFATAPGNVSSDAFFADSIIRGRIDEVDAGIQHRIQEFAGRVFFYDANTPRIRSPQAHAAIAELGYLKARSAQCFLDHAVSLANSTGRPKRAQLPS